MANSESVFATRLRMCRSKMNLTQSELASLIDADEQSIRNWEKGTYMPSLRTTIRLADVLDVSLDELSGRKPMAVA